MKGKLLLRAVVFLALSEVMVAALFATVAEALVRPVGYLALVLALIALPIFLSGTYVAALYQAHRLTLFNAGGVVRAFIGGRLLRSAMFLIYSIALAVTLFVGTTDASRSRFAPMLAPPVLGLVYASAMLLLKSEVVAPYRRAVAFRIALWLCPMLLVVVDFGSLLPIAELPIYPTLSDAVTAALPSEPAKSAVVDELVRLNSYANGIQAYALGRVGEWGGAGRLMAVLGVAVLHFAFYSALVRMAAPCLMPAVELRRGLLPADGSTLLTCPPVVPRS